MQFLFNGDVLRPATIAIEATDVAQAEAILESATKQGHIGNPLINLYDEDTDKRLAAFRWDGEPPEEDGEQ